LNEHVQLDTIAFQLRCWYRLCEEVCEVVGGGDIDELDCSFLKVVIDKALLDHKVLEPGVESIGQFANDGNC
jgi:hypothetical protein